jgi:hypothetical protein
MSRLLLGNARGVLPNATSTWESPFTLLSISCIDLVKWSFTPQTLVRRLAQLRQRVARLRLSNGPTILPCNVADVDMVLRIFLKNT